MRTKIVEAVLKDAPAWLLVQGRALAKQPGNIMELLLQAGFSPRDILDGCASVTGLPPAPAAWLKDPRPPSLDDLDVALLRRLGAAPIASVGGRLCIGFCDPEVAAASDKLGLPAHTPYLALPRDLQKAIAALPVADEGAPTRLQPARGLGAMADPATLGMITRGPDSITAPNPTRGATDKPPAPAAFGLRPGDADEDDVMTISADLSDLARAAAVMVGGPGADANVGFDMMAKTKAADPPTMMRTAHDASRMTESPTRGPADDYAFAAAGFDDALNESAKTSLSPSLGSRPEAGHKDIAGGASDVDDVDDDDLLFDDAQDLVDADPARAAPGVPDDLDEPRTQLVSVPPALLAASARGDPVRGPRRAAPERDDDADVASTEVVAGISRGDLLARVEQARAAFDAADADDVETARDVHKAAQARAPAPSDPTRITTHAALTPGLPEPARTAAVEPSAGAQAATDWEDGSLVDILIPDAPDDVGEVTDGIDDEDELAPATAQSSRPGLSATEPGVRPGANPFVSSMHEPGDRERLLRVAQLQAIKRYRFERVLGRGGMATVYAAIDTETGKPCAVKVMEPQLADDAAFVERFRREVRASRALLHDNIVRTYDAAETGPTYYMVSELVDGGTVQALAKAVPHGLPTALALPIIRGVLAGLQHAHEAGIVHRDLKPANLMLTSTGVVKIGDFGIGKQVGDTTITRTGALFGTPAYMSPEQAQGFELDARSDLYGAGIVFYELLAGMNPFLADSPGATMMNIARGFHPDVRDAAPHVSGALGSVVERLLARDRDARYRSARAALDDLASLTALVERRASGAVARAIKDPLGVATELSRVESQLHAAHAAFALEKAPPEPAEAAFHYHCALNLDAQNADAKDALAELKNEYQFRFTRPDDPKAAELEVEIREDPDVTHARKLLEIATRHRAIMDIARWTRLALALGGEDAGLRQRLERITGPDPLAPFSAPSQPARPQTSLANAVTAPSPVAPSPPPPPGAAPGEAAFDAVAAAAFEDSTAAHQLGDVAAQEVAPALALTPALTPSGGAARPMARRKIKDKVRRQEPAPEPEKPPEPPRPNLRELAMLDPSFPEPDAKKKAPMEPRAREDAPDVAAAAPARRSGFGVLIAASAVVIVLGAGVLAWPILAPRFGLPTFGLPNLLDTVAPPPPPSSSTQKPPPPASGAQATTEVKPPTPPPATPPPAPLPAAPLPAAPVVDDKQRSGDGGLSARQQQMIVAGTNEPDALKAVRIFTTAIEIDPHSVHAKEALLARARRYEAAGELERASKDFKNVMSRAPTEEAKLECEVALKRIDAALKGQ